ncbi:hypothetical protein evm_001182 [Chilo suppressalis]|nr:hypothetical protein evm_001182 [Chilo suppressalis]
MSVQVQNQQTSPIPLHRGVRQGDVISPKLFTNTMEDMFKTLNWKGRGININGERISHLRFADDIVIMAETLQDLQQMLNDLADSSIRIGLRMNLDKTKVMFNEHVLPEPIAIHGAVLEVVQKYVYLGQTLQLGRNNFEDEVNRRIQLGWAAFGKLRQVLTSSIPQCLKTKVFNQCVLPVMTYGAETWTLMVRLVHRFKVAQRAMERAMLGVSLKDRIRNENKTIFPVLRLLLPDRDRERGPYNLKEKNLGVLLVKVLSLSKQSDTARKLLNYRSVDKTIESDFAGVAYFALKTNIRTKESEVTVGKINEILDKIANAEVGNKGSALDDVFGYALKNLTAEQFKWFLRIILKDLKLGIGSNHILAAFHPDAPEYFQNCGSLSKVCDELEDGDTRPLELGIQVFYAVSPMLSERLDVTQLAQHISFDNTYIVENKFDGERFQIHMENGNFEYFSRKGHKYSDNYGKTYDSGLLTPFLKGSFNCDVKSFILDGEMMGWHKVNEHFSSKGIAFDVKKITDHSKFRPCFCAFDVLYYNGTPLVGTKEKGGLTLKERLKILDSMFHNVTGVIQHSIRESVNNSNDILDKLNQASENEDEGIVVKDVDSYYIPSRRNAGWYKIKPEYTESTMTDLDLVIIGADEAANKKQGRAKSFHVACVDKAAPGDLESSTRWLCVARVSTGLSYSEKEILCSELEKHWTSTRVASAPPQLVFNKEKPDFWILPEQSTVLQVRATELIRSVSYGTQYTLRFPRVVRVRDDKPVGDVTTLQYFDGLTPCGNLRITVEAILLARAVVGKINKRERAIIKSQSYDVVSSSWLVNLPPSEVPCTVSPLDLISIKRTTKQLLCRKYDVFGDSYTEDVDGETLKRIFAKMDDCDQNIYLTNQEMLNVDRDLFGPNNPHSFLRSCYIHFLKKDSFTATKAKLFSATICDLHSSNLTHVICENINGEEANKLKTTIQAHIVSKLWLEECFTQRKLVSESKFLSC